MYITLDLKPRRLIAAAAAVALLLTLPYLTRKTETVMATATPERIVCLTFDDGPSQYTAEVLDALDRHGVKATFFVTGQNEEYFDLIGEAHARGHLIALHTYSHGFSDIYAGREEFWADIDKLQAVIKAQTGEESRMLRFAGGSSNTVCRRYAGAGLMRQLVDDCAERGIAYFDWNIDTKDAVSKTKSAEYIAAKITENVSGHNPAVVLMHDGTVASTAAEALDIAIPKLLSEGYVFARLDQTVAEVHHSLP